MTDTGEVAVSGWETPSGLLPCDNEPDVVRDFVAAPESDPLMEAPGLFVPPPPALTELREKTEETDMRFASISDIDGVGLRGASGKWGRFPSSAMVPAESRGVSKSSTAISSLLVRLLELPPCLQASVCTRPLVLSVDDVRERGTGLVEGGGIEILARSALVSVVPGSAYRPFLETTELALEADDRLCEFLRAFNFGVEFSESALSLESSAFWAGSGLVSDKEEDAISCGSMLRGPRVT